MVSSTDETTLLKEDFQSAPSWSDEESSTLEINDAIESAGAGLGTILHVLGPFLLFCLEGGETVVLALVGVMVKCEWNLSAIWITVLQVCEDE